MGSEQKVIEEIYYAIKNNQTDACEKLITKINEQYQNSYILQYYAGMAAKKVYDYVTAEKCFKKSMQVHPFFALPVLELAAFYLPIYRLAEAEKVLMAIFDKKTLDPMSLTGELVYNVQDNLRICSMLGPEYLKSKDLSQHKKLVTLYTKMINRIKSRGILTYIDLEGWKNLCLGLGNTFMLDDPEKAHDYYCLGLQPGYTSLVTDKDYSTLAKHSLEKDMLKKLDKSLFQGLSLSAAYVLKPNNELRMRMAKSLYPVVATNNKPFDGKKIKVGYLSPDFNKNAAGLFLTPVLRDYNPDKFEIYCYYNHESSDNFTEGFKGYPVKSWTNIFNMPDEKVCDIMKNIHGLDILIDCIACGVGGRLELLTLQPAPKIVSYVGFPDFSYIPSITHRVSDNVCDPENWPAPEDCEKIIRLPRCFSCYSLFDSVVLPKLKVPASTETGAVKVGLLQKLSKWHPVIRKAWKQIFEKRQDFVLYVKEEQDVIATARMKEIIKDIIPDETRVKYIPFAGKLDKFLDNIQDLDFCLETYPYSGTTTTCSCLLMGVPVFTVGMGERHASYVTMSILKGMQMQNYVCETIEELIEKVCAWDKPSISRSEIRQRFLTLMDGPSYMQDFEQALETIVTDTVTPAKPQVAVQAPAPRTLVKEPRVKIEVVEEEKLKVLVQGWFDIPHSYAIVALNHIASMIEQGVDVYLQAMPYHNTSWKPVPVEELLSAKALALFKKAKEWNREEVDVVLRVVCENESEMLSDVPTVCFYTAETQLFNEQNSNRFIQLTKLGQIVPLTPSEWSAKALSVHKVHSHIIRHGVDTELFNSSREKRNQVRKEWLGLDATSTSRVFLHVGAMTGSKNVGGILKGFYDLVVNDQADVYLILKGMGDLYQSRELVRSALQTKITAGDIDQSKWDQFVKKRVKACYTRMSVVDLANLYKASDVYVSPYMAEGFNLPVLEAVACGLPIVVTEGGPVQEWNIPAKQMIYLESALDMDHRGTFYTLSDKEVYRGMQEALERFQMGQIIDSSSFIKNNSLTWTGVTKQLITLLKDTAYQHPFRKGLISGETLVNALQNGRNYQTHTVVNIPYTLIDTDTADVKIAVLIGEHAKPFFENSVLHFDHKVIVVLHNSDENIDAERYARLIDQEKVVACFVQNPLFYHPKLFALPIGIANSYWPHGDLTAMAKVRAEKIAKTKLCYVGFDVKTNPAVRKNCASTLIDLFGWQDQYALKTYENYLRHLKSFKYCVCPEGNGADTHRFWECLYLGVTPIVLKDSLITKHHWGKQIPVLMIDKWSDLTKELLEKEQTTTVVRQELLDVNYYVERIVKSAVTVPIVLIHLGDDVPEYLKDCIRQAQKVHLGPIYLYLDCAVVPDWITELGVAIVRPFPTKSKEYTAFLQSHPFCSNSEVQAFRNGFWQKCLERFFVLYDIMNEKNLTNVVHLESDVMLYHNLQELLVHIHKPFASVFMNEHRCVPGLVYVKTSAILQEICSYILKMNLAKNDMDILGDFANTFPCKVCKLPRTPSETNGFSCIFDAAPIGQFLGGTDPRNGHGGPGFINPDADYKVDKWNIQWLEDGPYYQHTKIAMLHVHSKNLKAFSLPYQSACIEATTVAAEIPKYEFEEL